MSYTLIIIVIAGIIAIILALSLVNNNNNTGETPITSEVKGVREIMTTDAHLHRLLMIEIIQDKEFTAEGKSLPSASITFSKMATGMDNLNKVLLRAFGNTIAQRIATLMQSRNDILREYYWALRTMTCDSGECVLGAEDKQVPVFPPMSLLNSREQYNQQSILDITTLTERKLQSIAREITDQVTASFNIKDVKSPIIHFQRLFNLIAMYDKELINQAKSYVTQQYTISMNCSQSSLDISNHISDEFGVLMNHERTKTIP